MQLSNMCEYQSSTLTFRRTIFFHFCVPANGRRCFNLLPNGLKRPMLLKLHLHTDQQLCVWDLLLSLPSFSHLFLRITISKDSRLPAPHGCTRVEPHHPSNLLKPTKPSHRRFSTRGICLAVAALRVTPWLRDPRLVHSSDHLLL